MRVHRVHECGACGKTWQHVGAAVQGNPLGRLGVSLVSGELFCDRLPESCQDAVVTRYDRVCDAFPEVFAEPGRPAPRDIEHTIKLKDPNAAIPRGRYYPMSPFELAECKR